MDKEGFIAGLADARNESDVLKTQIRQVSVMGDQAFVEPVVRLEGLRGEEPVKGTFRNLRLFERRDDRWRCVMWFNKEFD